MEKFLVKRPRESSLEKAPKQTKKEVARVRKSKPRKKCPHGRRKSQCVECGGASICEHKRRKSQCVECGGASICEHKRQRSLCVECGGASICEHKRRKSECVECGGASICEHKRRKSECVECGGASICEHKRIRSQCVECGGASICEHKRIKSQCVECGGASICEHKRKRSQCVKCVGASICEHGRQKYRCVECGGASICEHGRRKYRCVECGGASICKHKRRKSECVKCGGSALCKTELCETRAIKHYEGRCFPCALQICPDKVKRSRFKTKEHDVVMRLKETFFDMTLVHDKMVDGGAICSKKRPDVLLDMGSHVVFAEIDEKKHKSYEKSCEEKRIMVLWQEVQERPVYFVRFNPDSYTDEKGRLVKSCWTLDGRGVLSVPPEKRQEWEDRIDCLKRQVQFCADHPPGKSIEIIELFYGSEK